MKIFILFFLAFSIFAQSSADFIGFKPNLVGVKNGRTVSNILLDHLTDVKTFGAAGDGVTNDRAAFEAAKYYCMNSALVQHRLLVPPGNYLLDNTAGAFTIDGSGCEIWGINKSGGTILIDSSVPNAGGIWFNAPSAYQSENQMHNLVISAKIHPSSTLSGASWSNGTATFTTTSAHGMSTGALATVTGVAPPVCNITAASWDGTAKQITYTCSGYHGLSGFATRIETTVSDASPSSYNISGRVTVVDSTHFKLDASSNPGSYISGGVSTGSASAYNITPACIVTVTSPTSFTCAVELNPGIWISGGSVSYTNGGILLSVLNQNRFLAENVHVSGGTTCWVGGMQVSKFDSLRCTGMASHAITIDPSSTLSTSTLFTGKTRFGDSRGDGMKIDNANIWVGPGVVIENNQGYGIEVASSVAATVSLNTMHIEGNRHGFGKIGVGLTSGYGFVSLNDVLLLAEYPAIDSPSYGWEIDRGGLTVQHLSGNTGYNVNVFANGFAHCTVNSKPLRMDENIENGFSFGTFPFAPGCNVKGWTPGDVFNASEIYINGNSLSTTYLPLSGGTITGAINHTGNYTQTGVNPSIYQRGSGTPAHIYDSSSANCIEFDNHSSGEWRMYVGAYSSSDSAANGCVNGVLKHKYVLSTGSWYWTGNGNFTGTLSVNTLITASNPPTSSSDPCVTGTITWNSSYTFVCVASNTWKRTAISTW